MKFDHIAVQLLSSGDGTIFGKVGRLGGRVSVGLRHDNDEVDIIEIPLTIEDGANLSVQEGRDQALRKAAEVLRAAISAIDGKSYCDLAAQQDQQDKDRDRQQDEQFAASLSEALKKG